MAACAPAGANLEGWDATLTADEFKAQMGLVGDQTVLERSHDHGLVLCLVNPAGHMVPYRTGGAPERECRLPYAAALVESGVVDMAVLPEAHVDASGARTVRTYVAKMHPNVRAVAAPTSAPAAAVELCIEPSKVKGSTHSGIIVLLSEGMAERLEGVPTHYAAGRLLHLLLRFEDRPLHVVCLYGVSSPLQTAVKAHFNTEMAHELRRVLKEVCANEPTLVAGDLNVVRHAADRVTGRLSSYDDNPDAPWRVLEECGFQDVQRLKMGDRAPKTYVRSGEPCSRIDATYMNWPALNWGGDGGAGVKTAVTAMCKPLSPDHRAVLTSLSGHFKRARGTGTVTAFSAVPRPFKWGLRESGALDYTVEAARRDMPQRGKAAAAALNGWPRLSQALDELGGMPLKYTRASLDRSARENVGELGAALLAENVKLLNDALGDEDEVDLTELRAAAMSAITAHYVYVNNECNDVYKTVAGRAATAAGPGKEKGATPTFDHASLVSVVEQAVAVRRKLSSAEEVPRPQWDTLVDAAASTRLFTSPPASADGRAAKCTWVQDLQERAEGFLSLNGENLCGGTWVDGGHKQAERRGSLRLSTEQMQDGLKPDGGGGPIDMLLVDEDPDTGEPMPNITHHGMSRVVSKQLQDWSQDKSHGDGAVAYTSVYTDTLFDFSEDRRGMRRGHLRDAAGVDEKKTKHDQALRQIEEECETLLGSDNLDGIEALVEQTRAMKQYESQEVKAALNFMAMPATQKATVEARLRAERRGLPEEVAFKRALAPNDDGAPSSKPSQAPPTRSRRRVRERASARRRARPRWRSDRRLQPPYQGRLGRWPHRPPRPR